jgi:photosystem II stability/assembly factor-like uncharacterized protein/fibronectin type 3 domain-containing protein
MYAGSSDGKVFYSADRGATWSATSAGLPKAEVEHILVDPAVPSRLYAMVKGSGVFRSLDQGATWKLLTGGLETHDVYDIAIDSSASPSLYAATEGGVLRSVDQGVTWLPSAGMVGGASCVVADPTNSAIVYAGSTTIGVYRSEDRGATWLELATENVDTAVVSLAVDPLAPATIYACSDDGGLYRSDDGGVAWTLTTGFFELVPSANMIIDPVNDSTLYVVSHQGVLRSNDRGVTWASSSTGLTSYFVEGMAVNPITPSTIYAGTSLGVARSADGGATWTWMWPRFGEVTSVVVDPKTPSKLYAGTWGSGAFQCADSGSTPVWSYASGLSGADVMWRLAIDPTTPATIYAAGDGVFRSDDAGVTWKPINAGLGTLDVRALSIDPASPLTLYAGTWGQGIYRTDDGGLHWSQMSVGLGDFHVVSIAIAGDATRRLYVGTDDGVYRSDDHGATWQSTSAGVIPKGYQVRSLAISPSSPDAIFAGTLAGVFCSFDGGDSWSPASSGMDSYEGQAAPAVTSLAFAATDPPTLYAGTAFAGGVFRWVPGTAPVASPASVPGNLIATPSVTDIRLSWSASTVGTSPLAGYAVYRSSSPGGTAGTAVATVGTAVTSWTDTTCQQGTTYYYTVAAFDNQGTPLFSDKSSEVSAKLLPPPPVVLTLTLQMGSTRMLVSGSDGTSDTVTLDAAPVLGAGNRTLVPVRAVAEAMGGTVGWDPVTRTASVTVGSNTLELTLGKNTALFNGTATPIDTDPKVLPLIINGRTMLPLRFVVESLGAEVSYDQATKTITITYTKT